jgi:hypothetical protein
VNLPSLIPNGEGREREKKEKKEEKEPIAGR